MQIWGIWVYGCVDRVPVTSPAEVLEVVHLGEFYAAEETEEDSALARDILAACYEDRRLFAPRTDLHGLTGPHHGCEGLVCLVPL